MINKIKFILEKNSIISYIARYIYRNTLLKYKYYKQNKIFLNNANSVMDKIDKVFKELNINYWLEYGTLLGAIRDCGFIKHDLDIDLGLFLKDYSDNIEKTFIKHGFIKKRKISIDNDKYGLEETYELKGIAIDLFYFIELNEKTIYSHGFENEEGKSWAKTMEDRGGWLVRELYFPYDGIEYIDFLGKKLPIPTNAKEHLIAYYGDDFMVPNSDWKPYTVTTNVKFLDDKIGVVYKYE